MALNWNIIIVGFNLKLPLVRNGEEWSFELREMAAPGKCLLVTGPPVSFLRSDSFNIYQFQFLHFFTLLSFCINFILKGVGKTTLIMRVFESLKTSNPNLEIQGFYTRMLFQSHSLSLSLIRCDRFVDDD